MAKRIGANGRKKNARRGGRRPGVTGLLVAVACCAFVAVGAVAFNRYGERLGRLTMRFSGHSTAAVEKVVVQGAVQVNLLELLKRRNMSLPKTLDGFKDERLSELCKASPWIEKISVVRTAGNAVTLAIRERKPVAMLNNGTVWFVDAHGVCMPLSARGTYDLPLLSGLLDTVDDGGVRRLRDADCGRMNAFLRSVTQVDSLFAARISQACFGRDPAVTILLAGNPTVIVLHESGVAAQLERLARVWEGVQTDSLRPSRIDLSYRNIAFVAMPAARTMASGEALAKKNKG